MRTVSFFSQGARVAGVLRLPEGVAKAPVVVMCAGMTLTKEVWLPANAAWLCSRGYATLSFDYRGFGESEGARNRLVPSMQVEDVRAALTFLETVSEVDSARMGLFGVSLGASVAVATAGVDSRVKATVAVAGPMDLGRVWRAFPGFDSFQAKVISARRKAVSTGELSYIKLSRLLASDPETCSMIERDSAAISAWRPEVSFESLTDLFEFRPEAVVAAISPRAVMFVAPEHDELIARGELKSAFDAAKEPKRFVTLSGVKHHEVYGAGAGFGPTMDASGEFFGKYL
ncbi:MAG: alpha/beta fold hydrolase [Archangium sp.]|nr:alpha/beta fold hydrolase [Archangium sp.]MDP3573414.1 alpha/beta fold hydrolase [Archangium sp.]